MVTRDRTVGARLAGEIARGTAITASAASFALELDGAAGQSLGAFLIDGLTDRADR